MRPKALPLSERWTNATGWSWLINQFHAEGLRFAAFTLLRMVFGPGTGFTEPVHIATQNLKNALDAAGYPH